MSKLTHVRRALQTNPSITIVGAPEDNYLPGRSGYWSHTVDFHVAPKVGVYAAKELQALMEALIPELEPTMTDDFHEFSCYLQFGRLYFDEQIGIETVHQEIVLTDEEMFLSKGFIGGKQVIEQEYKVERRTWVRLFPNVQIAAAALNGAIEYGISKSEFTKYIVPT